jgi:O-antigen/teichoic acid export membrane protein
VDFEPIVCWIFGSILYQPKQIVIGYIIHMNTSLKLKIQEAGKHLLVYGLGSIAQSLAGLILLPLLTNDLSTTEFGAFAFIQMMGAIASTAFYLGINSALPRSYYDYEDEDERKVVFSTSFYITLLGAGLQLLCGIVFGKQLSILFFKEESYYFYIVLMLGSSGFGFVNQIFYTLLKFKRKSGLVGVFGVTTLLLNVAIVVSFLKIFKIGLLAPILGGLIVSFVIFIAMLILLHDEIKFNINKKEIKVLLNFGIPSVFGSLATMSIEWSDRFFINKFLSLEDVGVYSVGYKIGTLIMILLIVPFSQIWSPMMMEYRESDDIKELVKKIISYYTFAGVFIVILSTYFLSEIFQILIPGKDYTKGLTIFPIIMYGVFLNGFVNITCIGLFYARKISKMAYLYYLVAFVNVVLNYFLIPVYGVQGAAWSSFLTYSIIPVIIYFAGKKYFEIKLEKSRVFILLATCMGILLTNSFLQLDNAIERLPLKIMIVLFLGGLSYFFLLNDIEKKQIRKLTRIAAEIIRSKG